MEKGKNKSIIDLVWDLFASVKLAVVIFSLIALTSMVGTVLEQNAEPERNIQILVKMFGVGHETAHSMYGVLDSLGFMNMYHSWWFVSFLLLFAANLIICSLDRLPRIWKLVRETVRPLSQEHLEKMSIRRSFAIKGKASGIKDDVASSIGKIGFKPSESSAENGFQFYAEKGNFTRLGVYITHLSILIILAGAIIGLKFGFNAFLNLPEGQTTPVAFTDKGGGQVPLGFELRCDNFEVEYYGDSDMPKSYKSWLTVLKDGREVLKKVISVNDPLTYEGITFYQASYGSVRENMSNGILVLRVVSSDGKSNQVNTRIGGTFAIPGLSGEGRVANFSPALSFDQSGRPFTYDASLKNPAIFVELPNVGGTPYSGWIFKRYPQTWRLPDGSSLEFLDYWGVEYTGLQVRKDPGVLIVYLGCIIMAAGLYITFFMSHKRLWVNVAEEMGAAKIVIGASANRNRTAFERDIEKLAGLLGEGHKGGK
jgi:cytochrome c biogenesis protein